MDQDQPIVSDDVQIQRSREERRTTGRIVAVIVALSIIMLACYHAWIRKTAVLAGVIIPALIMVLYTAWVLYTAKRDKYRRNLELHGASLAEVLSMGPSSSSKTSEGESGQSKIPKEAEKKLPESHSQRHPPLERKDPIGASSREPGKKKSHPRVTLPEIPPHSGSRSVGKSPEKQDKRKQKRYNRSQSAA